MTLYFNDEDILKWVHLSFEDLISLLTPLPGILIKANEGFVNSIEELKEKKYWRDRLSSMIFAAEKSFLCLQQRNALRYMRRRDFGVRLSQVVPSVWVNENESELILQICW